MYNVKLTSYIPEPVPATTDRVIAAHYYAAWKYGAARLHEGFNDLAEVFPDRTPLMGYYDEENPEVCDWEIKWAVEHGINCFIHCWYRNLDNYGKPITDKDLRCGHGLHEALFNAKYQQYMKFAIMFEASGRWGGTDENDMLDNLMPFWMDTYFKRGNYLIIDNKPVLFVYNHERLARDCFKSIESQRETYDRCREYARQCGFDGMTFAVCIHNTPDKQQHDELIARGYDFFFGYSAGYRPPYSNYTDEEDIIEKTCDIFQKRIDQDDMRYIPTASCFRDSTPRFTDRWCNLGYQFKQFDYIWYLKPENFRRVLRTMKQMSDSLPEGAWARKIMMIDNWNEWDEGHFVAPSVKFGFKYLQAIREELTERDNLPDYRSPQDQGFTGYNTSWKTPDFAEFCKKKLEEEN